MAITVKANGWWYDILDIKKTGVPATSIRPIAAAVTSTGGGGGGATAYQFWS